MLLHVCREWRTGAHHVPDPQDDGSGANMAAQAAARGVPAVPRRCQHLLRQHLNDLRACLRGATSRLSLRKDKPLVTGPMFMLSRLDAGVKRNRRKLNFRFQNKTNWSFPVVVLGKKKNLSSNISIKCTSFYSVNIKIYQYKYWDEELCVVNSKRVISPLFYFELVLPVKFHLTTSLSRWWTTKWGTRQAQIRWCNPRFRESHPVEN